MDNPVFILSSERSGSNLLRRLIGKYSEIDTPVAIHHLKWMYDSSVYYGDFKQDKKFIKYVKYSLSLAYVHFSPWKIKLEVRDFLKIPPKARSALAVFDLMYSQHALQNGKNRFVCKDNMLFEFMYPILGYYKDPKFIYLYRDPRDYALSQYKRTLATNDLHTIATLWKEEQEKCFRALIDPILAARTYTLAYEDLIQNEEGVIIDILKFLNEPVQGKTPEPSKDADNEFLVEEWENLNKPVKTHNYNKYKYNLSKEKIRLIENICWYPMCYLGYTPENSQKPRYSMLELLTKKIYYRITDLFKNPAKKFTKKEYERKKERKKLIDKLNK